jgi:hypothetical protein
MQSLQLATGRTADVRLTTCQLAVRACLPDSYNPGYDISLSDNDHTVPGW